MQKIDNSQNESLIHSLQQEAKINSLQKQIEDLKRDLDRRTKSPSNQNNFAS